MLDKPVNRKHNLDCLNFELLAKDDLKTVFTLDYNNTCCRLNRLGEWSTSAQPRMTKSVDKQQRRCYHCDLWRCASGAETSIFEN